MKLNKVCKDSPSKKHEFDELLEHVKVQFDYGSFVKVVEGIMPIRKCKHCNKKVLTISR